MAVAGIGESATAPKQVIVAAAQGIRILLDIASPPSCSR